MGFGSLIDRLDWGFGLVVESWLWRWLVEFWVGDVCGCSGRQCCCCSGFRCVGFRSLIDRLGWDFGPVVVSWLWRWLVGFWVGDVCGYSGWRCLWL